jgi:hypothetical protein
MEEDVQLKDYFYCVKEMMWLMMIYMNRCKYVVEDEVLWDFGYLVVTMMQKYLVIQDRQKKN